MASKPETDLIDELLRQDEEELRAKKKRLRDFAGALDALRAATKTAETAAVELLTAGDVSRAELAKVFKLSRGERAVIVPAATRSGVAVADAVDEQTNAADGPNDEPS